MANEKHKPKATNIASSEQNGEAFGLSKKGVTMKSIKAKVLLVTANGNNWIVTKQYYAVDMTTNKFMDGVQLEGVEFLTEKAITKNENYAKQKRQERIEARLNRQYKTDE